jgi:iron complex outermembrane receptor protein
MPNSTLTTRNRINTRRIGIYAQDFISLTKQLKVIAGLRWSYVENMPTLTTRFSSNEKFEVANSSTSDNAFLQK